MKDEVLEQIEALKLREIHDNDLVIVVVGPNTSEKGIKKLIQHLNIAIGDKQVRAVFTPDPNFDVRRLSPEELAGMGLVRVQ